MVNNGTFGKEKFSISDETKNFQIIDIIVEEPKFLSVKTFALHL